MKYIKTITLCLGVILASALILAGIASAQSFKTGDNVGVVAGETVDSSLFIAGQNINIAGTVEGDVYCAGSTVNVSGTVNGDLICAGQTLTIGGTINGDIRVVAQSISLNGIVAGSATVGAQTLSISKDAVVQRDLLGGAQNATVDGKVARDFTAGAQNLTVNGQIGRDFNGATENFTVGATGQILGNVEYMSDNEVNVISGGKISGTVKRSDLPQQKQTPASSMFVFSVGWFIYSLISLLVVSLVLVALFPRLFKEAAEKASKKPGLTALVGVAGVFLTPILFVLLLITVVGIPLALLLLISWFVVIALTGPFASYMLGSIIMPDSKSPIWTMLAGGLILIITMFVPILNIFTMLAAYIFGMGMVLTRAQRLTARR